MCGRFYIDDETVREMEKIARKIDGRMAKIHESFASHNNLGIYQGIIYGKI